jgi:hypothetical protein
MLSAAAQVNAAAHNKRLEVMKTHAPKSRSGALIRPTCKPRHRIRQRLNADEAFGAD